MNNTYSMAPSITSSAGTTKSTSLPFLPRYTPKPEPAYISPVAAADFIVHNRDGDQLDHISPPASPTNESAVFSPRSLSLLNSFLDSLLYNFLAKAGGTSLSQLKPAIIEVLKAKLARDALASADEELEGLVGDAELDEQEDAAALGQDGWSQDWHLEMAFKRMRLRVMVFIRLGDFDDEDEERFLDEEDDLRNGEKAEQEDMLASPAAVYLAGVLEYIAERALSIIGDAVWKRASGKSHRRMPSDQSELSDAPGLIVHDVDVEKITLNPTLGRLWRTWRKNYRVRSGSGSLMPYAPPSPTTDRPLRGRLGSLNETVATSRRPSLPHGEEHENRHLSADEIPEGDVLESDIAANIPLPINDDDVKEIETIELPDEDVVAAIPLPIGDNDVNEIEVPGLAKEIVDDEEETPVEPVAEKETKRPLSAILSWLTPFSWSSEPAQERPKLQRMRSNSVPTRERPSFLGVEVFTPAVEEPESVVEPAKSEPPSDAVVDIEGAEPAAALPTEETETAEATPEAKAAAATEAADVEDTADDSEEKQPAKTGIIAGAVAGAAAIVGTAAAVVTRSSQKEQTAEEAEKLEVPQATKSDADKPKSPVSSSIADRRRMFEAQTKAANNKVDSSVTRELSPAPQEERKSPALQFSERSSSLKNKTTVAAAAAAAVPAVAAVEETMEPPSVPAKEVDPSVDRKTTAVEAPPVPDDRAIGVARTSDVPVPYPKATQPTSPPPDRQRSYHLPNNQGKSESGQITPPDRTASKDRSLVGADEYLMNRDQPASKTSPSPLRTVTKTAQEARQNGARVSNDGVTFYDSEDEKSAKDEQISKTAIASTTKPRPPPLKMAAREPSPESTLIRPTSGSRSATSTPGGHSTKNSASSSNMQRHLDKKSLEESRQRDFDSLLKNDEPVKYTLTPEDLRTTEVRVARAALADRGPPSPRIISSPGTYTAKRSPPRETNSTRRDTPSPTPGLAGNGRKVGVPRVSEYKRAAANRLSQRPEVLNTNSRRTGFMPREPRVITDNTADLADYMASTAPQQEQTVLPLARSPSNSKLQNNARTSSPLPRGTLRQKLVPREPDVQKDGTSELIDFIRQGPPGSKPEKEQRRTVAPFRNTMDSEDLGGLGDFANSVQTSLGTKRDSTFGSGLLGNSSTNGRSNLTAPGGPPGIVKKQRRVKDPYAIDSDDEDDYLTSLPPGGRAVQEPKEESLADFLRNSEPPTSNSPQPLNGNSVTSKHTNGSLGRSGSRTTAGGYSSSVASSAPRSAMISSGLSVSAAAAKARFEARAAGATRNGFGGNGFYYSTNDMADFLRSSGPVENMAPSQQTPLQKKPSKRGVSSLMSR